MFVDLGPVVEEGLSGEQVAAEGAKAAQMLIAKQSTLLQFIEHLGPALTHTKAAIRAAGVGLLSAALELLPTDFLHTDEVGLLVRFYTDRLKDQHSVLPPTLLGLASLVKADRLDTGQLETLLDRLFREVAVQQQVVKDRAVVFNMFSFLMSYRLPQVKSLETQFTVGFLQAGEEEKDPRNLLLLFSTTARILDTLSVDHLREDIFESLAVYFPIDFTPPKGIAASITKEDLILGLREPIAHPCLTQFSVPLFMEKLDSELESAKVDSLDTLLNLVARCGSNEEGREAWVADDAKLLLAAWSGLKMELMGIRLQASHDVLSRARNLITQISKFLCGTGSGLCSPAWLGGWAVWWGRVWQDCRPHLAATGTRLLQAATDVLAAIAESGVVGGREVVSSFVPALLHTWEMARGDDRRQLLASIDTVLASAASTGLELEPGLEWLDRLVALHLEEGGNLAGLAQAAGLLPPTYRREVLSNILVRLDSGQQEAEIATALTHMARWDAGLVRGEALPRLLELGDQALPALSAVQTAGLLSEVLVPVARRLREGSCAYSQPAVHCFLQQLAVADLETKGSSLVENVPEILADLLRWPGRPADSASPSQPFTHYHKVLASLSSLLVAKQADVLNDLDLGTMSLAQLDSLFSNLAVPVLEKIPHLINKAIPLMRSKELEHCCSSLVNKLPQLAEQLGDSVGLVGGVAHGLALRGAEAFLPRMERLLHMLDDEALGETAVLQVAGLLGPPTWLHPKVSVLHKQRVWSRLLPPLLTAASCHDKPRHLGSLVLCLPQLPPPLLLPHLPSLLPLLNRALLIQATAGPALSCLRQLLETSPHLVEKHVADLVPRCLEVCVPPSPLPTRQQALACLALIAGVKSPDVVLLSATVTASLVAPLQDRKRLVRQEAVRARNLWYLATQPS